MTHIVFLHGLGSHCFTFYPLYYFLIYYFPNFEYHFINYDIEKNITNVDTIPDVTQVFDNVEKLILNKGIKKTDELILIGQSFGGVVSNNLHKYGFNIKLSIYIGSPLNGARYLIELNNKLPTFVTNLLIKKNYKYLMYRYENNLKENKPPHNYHCVTMSWIFTNDFDGCVYKNDAVFDENDIENNTHLHMADHRTIFSNPRLWFEVKNIIERKFKN